MTPFGNVLSQLRRSRKLQQKELAEYVGIKASYVSAIEGGQKGPPSKPIIQKIIDALHLSIDEKTLLESSIGPSERIIRLPATISLEEYAFIWQLRQRLGSLSHEELMIRSGRFKLIVLGQFFICFFGNEHCSSCDFTCWKHHKGSTNHLFLQSLPAFQTEDSMWP